MSTDYGFKCETCETSHIIDNFRQPEDLGAALAIPEIDALLEKLSAANLCIAHEWCGGVQGAFAFLAQHRSKGHVVRVADEYGHFVDGCFKSTKCPTCSVSHQCVLKLNHAGECAAKAIAVKP